MRSSASVSFFGVPYRYALPPKCELAPPRELSVVVEVLGNAASLGTVKTPNYPALIWRSTDRTTVRWERRSVAPTTDFTVEVQRPSPNCDDVLALEHVIRTIGMLQHDGAIIEPSLQLRESAAPRRLRRTSGRTPLTHEQRLANILNAVEKYRSSLGPRVLNGEMTLSQRAAAVSRWEAAMRKQLAMQAG